MSLMLPDVFRLSRRQQYIDALGQSFRDFLKGRLPALPGEVPTLSDWADHLTTVFPEARIKEIHRDAGADGGPWRRLCALPPRWVGLICTTSPRWMRPGIWSRAGTPRPVTPGGARGRIHALDARVNGTLMRDLAREVLAISKPG